MTEKKVVFTPRLMTAAYLVWCWCRDCGWNCTKEEAARGARISMREMNIILRVRHPGWAPLFRVDTPVDGRMLTPEPEQHIRADLAVNSMGLLPGAQDMEIMPY